MMGFDLIFGPSVERGPKTRRIYLTFDDGPNERATPAILETLAAERVPAAFFMVGDHVRRFPGVAREVLGQGHMIGNHTYNHTKLHFFGPQRIRTQLQKTHAVIESTTGITPRSFRAPHGYRSPFLNSIILELSYTVFGWTFGVFDTAKPGVEVIRRRVRKRLRPGAIALLHDGDGYDPQGDRMQTARALPGIIADARNAGYEFAPLCELLNNHS
ncbi:MAG TPA: polysaccharide deacetylase family protein [Gemmatimonadales bacterium]|nr:polysaccharide deacetylase family protein [Gemmatimonadales bacterium]